MTRPRELAGRVGKGRNKSWLRVVLLAAAFVFAAVATLLANGSSGLATSGGSPYVAPAVVDTNPDPGIVETTLVADEANVDIGNGLTAHAQTINGAIPGPTFHLKVGDTVIVHYENHLNRESGLHWHGIELPNSMDGTPFTQNQVEPGGSFLYKFTVTRPGLFWYHPHHHASTNQVFKGLYGMIIVTDPNDASLISAGALPPTADTVPMVLSDTTVCHAMGSNEPFGAGNTYDPAAPWVGGGALPAQAPPTPKNLCEGPAVMTNPYPIDENGVVRPPFGEGDIPNIQSLLHNGRTNEGTTVLTNGKNVGARAGSPSAPGALAPGASTMDVQPGQGVRMQIVNASAVRYMRLRLTDTTGSFINLVRVGGEGGLLNNAVIEGGTPGGFQTGYTFGEILLPPGSRADVVAAIPPGTPPGVATLWTEDYQRTGGGYSNIPTVPVAHFNVTGAALNPAYTISNGTPLRAATGDPVEALGAPTGTLLDPATFTPAKLGMAGQNVQFTQNGTTELGVNGVFGTHDVSGDYADADHLGSSRYAKQGDTLELTMENVTGAHHPFHLHGFSIQPIKLTKPANPTFTWPYPEFRDNVDVPEGYTLTFRIKLDPRPQPDGTTPGGALGRWLLHCHIFFHATNGMLSELVVTAPDGNERPDVNVNGSDVAVNQGQTATMTGSFSDPDGNPVTLKASVGTVTDTGGGNWSWTYPTGGQQSRIVYITGTDSHGLIGQIPFKLNVTDTAPVVQNLKVKPKKVKTNKKGKPKKAKAKFNVTERGTARLIVERLDPKKPKARLAYSKELTAPGQQSLKLKLKRKKKGFLPPGKYRLTVHVTDSKGLQSNDVKTKFKIKKKKKH